MKTVVYTSDKSTHFFKELKEIIRDISKSNFLAYQMAKRDLQAQYRQSYFGFLWAIAPILVNSVVWIFLNSSGAVNIKETQIPYVLFTFIGTTLWSIFTESLTLPISSVNAGKNIISKINFPKEALIMANIYKLLFNLVIKLFLVIIFLFMFKTSPSLSLCYFPLYLLALIIFPLSIGLILAPIGLIYSDVDRILSVGTPFLMYVTPVVFLAPKAGIFSIIFKLNPLTYIITDARNSLTGYEVNNVMFTIVIVIISFIIASMGLVIFRKSMSIIIEKIAV